MACTNNEKVAGCKMQTMVNHSGGCTCFLVKVGDLLATLPCDDADAGI